MKNYLPRIIVAAIFAGVAIAVLVKLPFIVHPAFVIAAALVGWLVTKNNIGEVKKLK